MQKALQEDDQEASEGSWYQVLIKRHSFSQQLFPTPLISRESETSTGSSVVSKGSQESETSTGSSMGCKGSQRASLRSLGNSHDQTSRLQQLSLVTSSSPCDTTTKGCSKACSSHLPKQIFPWMKETRRSTKQKSHLPFPDSSSPPGFSSSKRVRTAYTQMQLVELEKEFHFNRYLCRPRRLEMAQLLRLSERQIKIWFQNRRMKYKKDSRVKSTILTFSNNSPQVGGYYGHVEADYEMAPSSSCSKSLGQLYNSTGYTDPLCNSPLTSVSWDYGPFSGPGESNLCGPPVLQGSPSVMGENYLGNVPRADSFFSYPDYSSGNLEYSCVAEIPSHPQLGPSNSHPIYTDLTTHPVPQGDSQGPVNLMHL